MLSLNLLISKNYIFINFAIFYGGCNTENWFSYLLDFAFGLSDMRRSIFYRFSIPICRSHMLDYVYIYMCVCVYSINIEKCIFWKYYLKYIINFIQFFECKDFHLLLRLYRKWNISIGNIHNIDIKCNTNSYDAIYSWSRAMRTDIDRKPVKYSLAQLLRHKCTLRHDARPRNKYAGTYTHVLPRVYKHLVRTIALPNPLYTNLVILCMNQWYFFLFISIYL